MVETGDETDRVLDGSRIALCLDTGHLLIGGGDPVRVAVGTPTGSPTCTSRTCATTSPAGSAVAS